MNRKRLAAALLALCMLAALMPLSARAEEAVLPGAPVSLVFTSDRAVDFSQLTVLDADGNHVFPLSGADGSYLLSPGTYSYFFRDPSGALEALPVTSFTLDGSVRQVEIALPLRPTAPETPGTLTELPRRFEPAEDPAAYAEDPAAAMPVVFQSAATAQYSALTVTDERGNVQQPYMDPLTGEIQYQNYLLPPGQYCYQYRDPGGRFADCRESFTVTDGGVQFVTLNLPVAAEGACYSATAVNPCYADVIREDYIPRPSVSPEQSLALLLEEVSAETQGGDLRTVYYAPYGEMNEGQSVELNSPIVYESPEAAGAALRRALLQRQTEIPIRIRTGLKPSDETWWNLCWLIYDTAIRHSGAPTEGDYLRYEYGGVNCNGSAAELGGTGEYYYSFIYSPLYFTTLQQEAELTVRVDQILGELMLIGKSDEQKIRAVYQYLCDTVQYEESRDTLVFTAYDALVNGRAACQGVAVAFYRLCLELGVDARIVTSKEMGHCWNIARADGRRYYALDATWDAGKTPESWEHYLRGRLSWQKTHGLGDEFTDGRYADYSFPDEDYGAGSDAVIHSVSLLFDGLLRIKYYFILPTSVLQAEGAAVRFSRNGEPVASIPISEARREGEYSCFYCSVSVDKIADPIQARITMGDGSSLTIRAANGTSYPNGFFFSPMEYARQMKESASSVTMRALAQALEDYGIAAQNYFSKESGSLRDAVRDVRAEDLDAWTIRSEGSKPQGFAGASLSVLFEADNSLRLYLHCDAGSEKRFTCEIDGKPAALREKEEGVFYLSVDNIAADALDTRHCFTISDGTDSYSITAGVLSYARTAIERGDENMANLGRALYLYNRAAEAYFAGG